MTLIGTYDIAGMRRQRPTGQEFNMLLPTVLAEATTQAASQGAPLLGNAGIGVAGVMIGVGILVVGAAKGIGHIGGSAVESIARQPEAGGRIFTNMIIAAALIEGIALIAMLVVGLPALGKL